jgi:hypothetical protein
MSDKDIQAKVIITNCLESNQVSHIIVITSKATSNESWDELCRLYEAQDFVTKMYLKERPTTLKMKENESVTKHIHTFRSLLNQLFVASAPLSDKDSVIALMRSSLPGFATSWSLYVVRILPCKP